LRSLETVLVAIIVLALGARVLRGSWMGSRLLGGLLALAFGAHLVFEGVRLPILPAYLAGLWCIGGLFGAAPAKPRRAGWRRALGWVGGVVTMALVAFPPALFPIFRLPTPPGPFPIGGTIFSLADESRREPFGPDSNAARHLVVRAWYPAAPGTGGRPMRYADPRELASPIISLLPEALTRQYRYVRTHTEYDADLADGVFPVLVFSHGYTSYLAQNTPQMEALASQGYLVFSIGHSHDATAVIHPDGRVATLDPEVIASLRGMIANQDSVMAVMGDRMAALERAKAPEERQAAFRAFAEMNPPRIARSAPVWAADTRHLLDQFRRADGPGGMGRFVGKLDTTRIGIFGMSFGGSNAGLVCSLDPRCKAGVNIDGQQFGDLINGSLATPFMIIASDPTIAIHRPIYDRLVGPGYLIKLVGTQHMGLTDLPYLAPWVFRTIGLTGTMPVARSEQLMTDYLTAFFDQYLKGKVSPLLAQTGSDDVVVESKNR